MKPRILDLFCGAGGAGQGLHQAGFEVVGVDIAPQPHYPFELHLADALTFPLEGFDAYWASPPCQHFSKVSNITPGTKDLYPDLVDPIRQRLVATCKPYIIENVPGAPLINPMMLCGTMFGLKVRRHRLFECSFPLYFSPASCNCRKQHTGAFRHLSSFARGAKLITVTGHCFNVADGREAMGIDWMTAKEISQAIPPAYSEFLGKAMLEEKILCLAT